MPCISSKPVELGVVIGKRTSNIRAAEARDHISGYVCAIDVTARDWQSTAKAAGRPWSLAKGCDTFLPVSTIIPADAVKMSDDGVVDVQLYLDVNGERRQCGSTRHMIWSIPELLERISEHVTLEEWDLVLTGTPAGVNTIRDTDVIKAGIEGLVEMQFSAEQKGR